MHVFLLLPQRDSETLLRLVGIDKLRFYLFQSLIDASRRDVAKVLAVSVDPRQVDRVLPGLFSSYPRVRDILVGSGTEIFLKYLAI